MSPVYLLYRHNIPCLERVIVIAYYMRLSWAMLLVA